jgi:hypothetical protein
MDSAAVALTGELSDELEQNSKPVHVDPRTVPARFSTLKQFSVSPLHYWHASQNEWEETLSMRLGSGAHAMLFDQPFAVYPGPVRNGKVWTAFEQEHAGQLILIRSEVTKAEAMAKALRSHSTAMRLLFTGTQIETRIDWSWQGRAFRSTPDATGRTHLVDLKCLRSADPEAIKWQSRKMFYHCQAAMYRRALNSDGQHHIKECYLVVVENKAPHPVTVLRFTNTALEAGDRTTSAWLADLLACEARGSYPGYVETIVDLDLPVTESDLVFDDDEENED